MRRLLVAAFLLGVSACFAEVLRISEVVAADGDEVELMTLKGDDWEEELLVRKAAIVTEEDVERAYPLSQGARWLVGVELKEEGGAKMVAATEKLKPGTARLAIVVDGELVSAPTLNSVPIGAKFHIDGGKGMNDREASSLARRISGLPPLPANEVIEIPEPRFEYEPYTEEEYQERKAAREKLGFYHLEWIPSEEELDRQLRKGMSRADVMKVFGKPTRGPIKLDGSRYRLSYVLAPEKVPDNPEKKMMPISVEVDFEEEKVSGWSHSWSSGSRELKVKGQEKGLLEMILPEMDINGGEADIIEFFEAVAIPDPDQKVNRADLAQLASLGVTLKGAVPADPKEPGISAHCDLVKEIARHFPEVAELRNESEKGRISIEDLSKALEPYAFGEKELPMQEVKED